MPTPRTTGASRTLAQHISFIQQVLARSERDPEARQLAVKIVSGVYDYKRDPKTHEDVPVVKAWGKTFRAPADPVCKSRNDECEIERIWDFLVLNFRYVYDPADQDTFQTLKVSLTSGGGDCDDATIAFATLLKQIGFFVKARVISTQDAPDVWAHIYPLVGLPKDNPTIWMPLDITVEGYLPGNEYNKIADFQDFKL